MGDNVPLAYNEAESWGKLSGGVGSVPTLRSGVQSTDFSRAFVKQERAQLKLVLYTPLN